MSSDRWNGSRYWIYELYTLIYQGLHYIPETLGCVVPVDCVADVVSELTRTCDTTSVMATWVQISQSSLAHACVYASHPLPNWKMAAVVALYLCADVRVGLEAEVPMFREPLLHWQPRGGRYGDLVPWGGVETLYGWYACLPHMASAPVVHGSIFHCRCIRDRCNQHCLLTGHGRHIDQKPLKFKQMLPRTILFNIPTPCKNHPSRMQHFQSIITYIDMQC